MIDQSEIKTESWPPQKGLGGQHVGTGPSGVKVTHIPTGIEASVDVSKSQYVNRMIAIEMIEAAITHPRIGSK